MICGLRPAPVSKTKKIYWHAEKEIAKQNTIYKCRIINLARHTVRETIMPQVENTVTVAATGPSEESTNAESSFLQRLDAQPSISVTTVRSWRAFLSCCCTSMAEECQELLVARIGERATRVARRRVNGAPMRP